MDARPSPAPPEDGAPTRRRVPRRVPTWASASLVAGLLASVAAGIAACRAVGPYGDGPFGAGFRRLPAAEAGGTVLVHDARAGPDVVRAVIDEGTGRVRELRLAPGGDFAVALRLHVEEDGGVRTPRDLDGDGVPDRWEYYADVRDVASGDIEKLGFSLAGDEVVDAWAYHDEAGEIRRVDVSTGRDGVVDRWEHYRSGALLRVESDRDRDGRVDHWSTFSGGILKSTQSDADDDGLPDLPEPGER
jgi:hypothetical protein